MTPCEILMADFFQNILIISGRVLALFLQYRWEILSCHTHKGSGILPICCWDPVYPYGCGGSPVEAEWQTLLPACWRMPWSLCDVEPKQGSQIEGI